MPAPYRQESIQEVPLKIVGGNHFGRYPKISVEQTFNMIISDGALVEYAGYKNIKNLNPNQTGRSIYSSNRGEIILAVVGSGAYTIDLGFNVTFIGNLATSSGSVYIAENNASQIAFTDGVNLYVWNYSTMLFSITTGISLSATFGFTVNPGYISFQNGRFILTCNGTTTWLLSNANSVVFQNLASSIGSLQTKPDRIQAAVPFPGRGNLLFIFGENVVEPWVDVGAALFPYQKQASYNIDYGCLNPSSIAELGNIVIWLGANEQSGPVIMISDGNSIKEISTDGIDFKFSELTQPTDCIGFLIKLDGHLIYQFTFKTDNLTYLYDLNTGEFFTATDENLNYHVARKVIFFNNQYYFVSFNDGNLYQIGTQFTDYQYSPTKIETIPRIRICPPTRFPSQLYGIIKSLSFTIENGQPNNIQNFYFFSGDPIILGTENINFISTENFIPIGLEQKFQLSYPIVQVASQAVDLSISRDGGENFGNQYRLNMNPPGVRKSRFIYQRLGQFNDCSVMLQFWGFSRFVVFDGVMEIYQ